MAGPLAHMYISRPQIEKKYAQDTRENIMAQFATTFPDIDQYLWIYPPLRNLTKNNPEPFHSTPCSIAEACKNHNSLKPFVYSELHNPVDSVVHPGYIDPITEMVVNYFDRFRRSHEKATKTVHTLLERTIDNILTEEDPTLERDFREGIEQSKNYINSMSYVLSNITGKRHESLQHYMSIFQTLISYLYFKKKDLDAWVIRTGMADDYESPSCNGALDTDNILYKMMKSGRRFLSFARDKVVDYGLTTFDLLSERSAITEILYPLATMVVDNIKQDKIPNSEIEDIRKQTIQILQEFDHNQLDNMNRDQITVLRLKDIRLPYFYCLGQEAIR